MKKSLLTVLAFAMAGMASAATITWGSGVLYTPASAEGGWSTTKAKTSVTASYYLITASEYATLGTKSVDELVTTAKSKTADATITSKSTTSKANWEYTGAAAGATTYVLAVYSTTYDGTEMHIATVKSATVGTGGAAVTVDNIASGIGSWTAPIPEPTTVALLALGLAALGLKRKVA